MVVDKARNRNSQVREEDHAKFACRKTTDKAGKKVLLHFSPFFCLQHARHEAATRENRDGRNPPKGAQIQQLWLFARTWDFQWDIQILFFDAFMAQTLTISAFVVNLDHCLLTLVVKIQAWRERWNICWIWPFRHCYALRWGDGNSHVAQERSRFRHSHNLSNSI